MTNNEYRNIRREYDTYLESLKEDEDDVLEPQPPDCNRCKYFKEGFCAVNPSYLGDTANCPDYRELYII